MTETNIIIAEIKKVGRRPYARDNGMIMKLPVNRRSSQSQQLKA
jgi:hypothetical protein